MADPVIVSQRRADAQRKFEIQSSKLAERLGIHAPKPVGQEYNRDVELKKVVELETVVNFMEAVNVAMDKPAVAKAVQNAVAGVVPVARPKDAPPAPAALAKPAPAPAK